MPSGTGHAHIMMYSHDTFGLGHLRRSRTVAHAIVERLKQSNVMIVSGSAIAGAFDLRTRVDFIKIPSVIKLYNGDYTSLAEHTDLADTLRMRRAILQSTAEIYRPDVFIVDKEPLGLRGELEPTLTFLKDIGCRLVLGLREVLDSPDLLRSEWQRSNALDHIDRLYDEIWVYGCETFWNPLTGLDVPERIRQRMRFMGYLERFKPGTPSENLPKLPERYILVTAGGGGDGAIMMDQVLAAHELVAHDGMPDFTAAIVMVLGPFMRAEDRDLIKQRAERVGGIVVIDFDARVESLMVGAEAIVSMGGYNTFCEILSFDKPALLIPRTAPRREQFVRAERANALGLVDMLTPDEADDPAMLRRALVRLLSRKPPSESPSRVDLGGLNRVSERVASLVGDPMEGRRVRAEARA